MIIRIILPGGFHRYARKANIINTYEFIRGFVRDAITTFLRLLLAYEQ